MIAISADASQVRFTTFALSIACIVNGQARAPSVEGVGGGPSNNGNDQGGQPVDKALPAVAVPAANDLAVTVADWNAVGPSGASRAVRVVRCL